MSIDYTATEIGGFDTTSYYTALTLDTDGTTSTTDNFTFAKVTGSTTDLVITKPGTALSLTLDTDAAAASDITAYEYTLLGNTYLAVFYVKNGALHFAVYDDELEVVEADNTLTSTYTTIDGVHGIYSHGNNGEFVVDASSTSGSSGNYWLSYDVVNSAPEFLSGVVGEADSDRPAAFTASEIGEDDESDTMSFTAISVTSGKAIYVTDNDGKVYVYYTGPTLAEGATTSVTLDLTLTDGTDTTDGTYTATFTGTGTSTLDLSLAEVGNLIGAGYDTLALLGGNITGINLAVAVSALSSMTTDMLDHLTAAGVNVIDIAENATTFTKDEADVFTTAGVTFASDDVLTLTDAASTLGILTSDEVEDLAALGIGTVGATDDVFKLFRSTFDALEANNIAFADTSALVVQYVGTEKKDTLDGTDYVDILLGLGKNDVLNGLAGDDQLYGDEGADKLSGGAGSDVLRAGIGDDTVKGGAGADILTGGEGSDRLSGGGGADIFMLTIQAGHDVISDFQGTDKIDLSAFARFEKFSDVKAIADADGEDLVLTIGSDIDVTLTGVSIKDLVGDNFIF